MSNASKERVIGAVEAISHSQLTLFRESESKLLLVPQIAPAPEVVGLDGGHEQPPEQVMVAIGASDPSASATLISVTISNDGLSFIGRTRTIIS